MKKQSYKLLKIINYINSNYIKDFKNKKSITKYYFFIKKTIII